MINLQHKEIKTYSFAEKSDNSEGFNIQKLGDEENQKETPDKPHRHDYYTILFIEKGAGIHYIDFKEYKIDSTVYFILPGQMHQLIFTAEKKGWFITFTEEFLIANSIPEKLINDIYLFNDYGQSPPLTVTETDLPVYKSLIEQMYHFSRSLENYTLEAVGSLVKLFLIQSNNHCTLRKNNNPQLQESGNHILRTFKYELNRKYMQTHKVSDYADELSVTADYLNKTVKNLTGKSAKEHIQSKLTTEAKRLLLFSNISNKELGFELGFEEAAHFHNFFKRTTGQTPAEFRTLARQS